MKTSLLLLQLVFVGTALAQQTSIIAPPVKSVFPPAKNLNTNTGSNIVSAQPAQGRMNPIQNTAPQPAIQNSGSALPPTSAMESIFAEDMIRSLRDPFQIPTIVLAKKETPKTDLELYALKDIRLNGVITGPKKLRAIVATPNNKTYFIAIGDHIGLREGRITSIQSDAIKVVEYEVDEHGKKIPETFEIRMDGDVVSLSKKEE